MHICTFTSASGIRRRSEEGRKEREREGETVWGETLPQPRRHTTSRTKILPQCCISHEDRHVQNDVDFNLPLSWAAQEAAWTHWCETNQFQSSHRGRGQTTVNTEQQGLKLHYLLHSILFVCQECNNYLLCLHQYRTVALKLSDDSQNITFSLLLDSRSFMLIKSWLINSKIKFDSPKGSLVVHGTDWPRHFFKVKEL